MIGLPLPGTPVSLQGFTSESLLYLPSAKPIFLCGPGKGRQRGAPRMNDGRST